MPWLDATEDVRLMTRAFCGIAGGEERAKGWDESGNGPRFKERPAQWCLAVLLCLFAPSIPRSLYASTALPQ